MQGESQQKPLTITLNEGDWGIILAGLYELPMKHSGPVAARLQTALAEAQKPLEETVTPIRGSKS